MKSIIAFLVLIAVSGYSQTLKINMSNIRNAAGLMCLGFYTSDENFDKDKPLFVKLIPKNTMVNGTLTITYKDIKPGTYGIALLDDENNNDKMDYGLILPKEGFGFSNYYHTGLSKPNFTKFKFTLTNETKTVNIKVKYM
ncbi:MAG: DUF2141 domain-containing protein [Bacteroidia bacterium]